MEDTTTQVSTPDEETQNETAANNEFSGIHQRSFDLPAVAPVEVYEIHTHENTDNTSTTHFIIILTLLLLLICLLLLAYLLTTDSFLNHIFKTSTSEAIRFQLRGSKRVKWCSACCPKPKCQQENGQEIIDRQIAATEMAKQAWDQNPELIDHYDLIYRVEFLPFVTQPMSFVAYAEFNIAARDPISVGDLTFEIDNDLQFYQKYVRYDHDGKRNAISENYKFGSRSFFAADRVYAKHLNLVFNFTGRIYEGSLNSQTSGYIFRKLRKYALDRELNVEYIISAELFSGGLSKILPNLLNLSPQNFTLELVHKQANVVHATWFENKLTTAISNEKLISKYIYFKTLLNHIMFFEAIMTDCDFNSIHGVRIFVPYLAECVYHFDKIHSFVKERLGQVDLQDPPTVVMLDETYPFIDQFQYHPQLSFIPFRINFNLTLVSLQFHFNVYHFFVKFYLTANKLKFYSNTWKGVWLIDVIFRVVTLELFMLDNPADFSVDFYFRDRVIKGSLWGDDSYGHLPAIADVIDGPNLNDLMRWKLLLVFAPFMRVYMPEFSRENAISELIKELRVTLNASQILKNAELYITERFCLASYSEISEWFQFRGTLFLTVDSYSSKSEITPRIHCRYNMSLRGCEYVPETLVVPIHYLSDRNLQYDVVTINKFSQTIYFEKFRGKPPYFFYTVPMPYVWLLPERFYLESIVTDDAFYQMIRLHADFVYTVKEGYHGPHEKTKIDILKMFCVSLKKAIVTRLRDKPRFFNAMNFFAFCEVPPWFDDHMQNLIEEHPADQAKRE